MPLLDLQYNNVAWKGVLQAFVPSKQGLIVEHVQSEGQVQAQSVTGLRLKVLHWNLVFCKVFKKLGWEKGNVASMIFFIGTG